MLENFLNFFQEFPMEENIELKFFHIMNHETRRLLTLDNFNNEFKYVDFLQLRSPVF